MKPISILLSINIALLAVWCLIFFFVAKRPEYIPLFTSFQTALNILGAGIFFLDRKRDIAIAFLVGALIAGISTGAGYYLLDKYGSEIRVEESYTS